MAFGVSNPLNLDQVIDPSPLIMAPDTAVLEAIARMSQFRASMHPSPNHSTAKPDPGRLSAGCALVVKESQLVGIFTEKDVVQLVATGQCLPDLTMADVMTRSPLTLKPSQDQNLESLLTLFRQHQLCYLPVVNDRNQVLGLISQASLLQGVDVNQDQSVNWQGVEQNLRNGQQAEVALGEQESWLKAMFEHSAIGMVINDMTGRFIRANPAYQELVGYSEAELQTMKFIDLTYEDHRSENLQLFEQIVTGQQDSFRIEKQYCRRDGNLIWVRITASVISADQHGTKIAIAVVEDISPRKQAEAALRTSEQRFRSIFDSAFQLMGLFTVEGAILNVNETALNFAGLLPKDVVGRLIWETAWFTSTPLAQAQMRQGILRAAQGELVRFETRMRSQDHTLLDIDVSLKPLLDEEGQVYQIVVEGRDITERKQAESALQEAYEQLEMRVDQRTVQLKEANQQLQIEITERRRVEEELRERAAKIRALYEVTSNQELDFHERLQNMLTTVCQQLNLNYGSVACIEGDRCELIATYASDNAITRGDVLNLQDTFCVQTLKQSEPLIIDHTSKSEWKDHPACRVRHLETYMGNRLLVGSQVYGTLCFCDTIPAPRSFKELDRELLMLVTQWVEGEIERQQVIESLRKSEERWQLVLQGTNDGIWDWDFTTHTVFRSVRWKEMFGFTDAEISNSTEEWSTRIHPDDYERVMQAQQDHFDRKTPFFQAEYRIRHQNGSYLWVLNRGQAIWNEAGQVVRMLGLETDISQRKQTELALQESQQFVQSITDNSPNILYIQDLVEQCNVYANQEIRQLLGYTPEEIQAMGANFLPRLAHPEDLEYLYRQGQKVAAAADDEIIETEYRLRHANGSWRWFYSRDTVFKRDPDGRVRQMLGCAQDITDRKQVEVERQQAEWALRESEARLRLALKAAQMETWDWNILTDETLISEHMGYVFGLPSNTNYPNSYKAFLDVIYPADQAGIKQAIAAALEQGTDYRAEFRVLWPDGTLHWLGDRGQVYRNAEGQPIRMIGVIMDITERKQVEEEIRKALEKERELGQLKSRFISMASHEFRTPLAIISSSAGILEDYSHRLPEEKKREHLRRIQITVKRMTQLLDDVLMINRAEAEKLEFNPQPLNLTEMCQNLVDEMQLNAHQHQIVFSYPRDQDTALHHCCIDQKLVWQILTNLLTNAIKYSPNGDTIQFQLTLQDHQVVFQIQDQGIGIPLEDQAQLFESFYRGKNVGAIPGTGLGLAIVKKCVDLHQGTITVDSQGNVGTTFTVSLPINH
ncbi:MAG: PAS domain S-box protein [Leptolyngbyaceae bacterium]|nr:PAS domain S-box protein [Leptolyngbyaceae bacterium]